MKTKVPKLRESRKKLEALKAKLEKMRIGKEMREFWWPLPPIIEFVMLVIELISLSAAIKRAAILIAKKAVSKAVKIGVKKTLEKALDPVDIMKRMKGLEEGNK